MFRWILIYSSIENGKKNFIKNDNLNPFKYMFLAT